MGKVSRRAIVNTMRELAKSLKYDAEKSAAKAKKMSREDYPLEVAALQAKATAYHEAAARLLSKLDGGIETEA
jgi:hypothetical protein